MDPINRAEKPKVGARDFFLHLGFIAALYTLIGTFVSFIFSIINTVFPDRQFNYYDPYGSGMRTSVSILIVVTPLFIFLLRKIYAHIKEDPAAKEFVLRKFALYFTLTLAIVALAIDLIVLINSFLGGEITTRFSLKAFTVIILGSIVWLYTRQELKESLAYKPKLANMLYYGVGIVVFVSIISGFYFMGSPTLVRDIRDDQTREQNLDTIKYQVLNYYQTTKDGKLPATLNETIVGDPYSTELPKDPKTELPYEYKIQPDTIVNGAKFPTFALCATFAKDSKERERVQGSGRGGVSIPVSKPGHDGYYPGPVSGFSEHPAGNKCFDISIDPSRFKPHPQPLDTKPL